MALITATMNYHPGDIVPPEVVAREGIETFFAVSEIPDSIFAVMQGRSYKAECIVPRSQLRYLTCLHCDREGVIHVGEMVLNVAIAETVLQILRQLYEASYPIACMRLVDYYEADDERAMQANNSSSFNFRFISHTHRVSRHGLGMAVDINPLYNPYHKHLSDGTEVIEPAPAAAYLDRQSDFPYKIVRGDLCWRLFTQHGFQWGGSWTSCKDYQHFEVPAR